MTSEIDTFEPFLFDLVNITMQKRLIFFSYAIKFLTFKGHAKQKKSGIVNQYHQALLAVLVSIACSFGKQKGATIYT